MATTPEQFVQGLRRRGIHFDLVTEEPEPRFRLTGPRELITDRIREYIRRNRVELSALFAQARCCDCWHLVDEHDESTWHLTDEGELYCIECWQELTKPPPEPWELEASAFLSHVVNDLGFSIFRPIEAKVTHIPTGRTWMPSKKKG